MDTSISEPISREQDMAVACETSSQSEIINADDVVPPINSDNDNGVKELPEKTTILSPVIIDHPTISGSDDNDISNNNHIHYPSDSPQPKANIKLKRCKHGRIIIKDLSKKKLNLTNDRGSSVPIDKPSDEIEWYAPERQSSDHQLVLDNSVDGNLTKYSPDMATCKNLNSSPPLSPILPSSNIPMACSSSPISSSKHIDIQQPKIGDKNKRASDLVSESKQEAQNPERRRRLSRGRSRSPSSRGSKSPNISRIKYKTRSPLRSPSSSQESPPRRREDRSPRRRVSRSPRRRGSSNSRRRKSPSPRRRDRDSPYRKRRSKRPRRNRTRSPRASNYRDKRSSPSRVSSRRKTSRSRSLSSDDSDLAHRIRRRDSRSPIRDQHSSEKRYSTRDTIFDRLTRKKETLGENLPRTPIEEYRDDRRVRADDIDSGVPDNFGSTNPSMHADNHNLSKKSDTKSLAPGLTQPHTAASTNPTGVKSTPQVNNNDSLRDSPPVAARSPPRSPSNESISSDIYDPEGPILPISPGDSPPLSPINDISYAKPIFRSTDKNGDDDVPSSAVQLNQQEKYLQKLNRQERVVEEVKMALRPHYQNRSIDKEQYKDVLRKAVPKICHSKKGEINPIKIRGMVDAYVRKMRLNQRS